MESKIDKIIELLKLTKEFNNKGDFINRDMCVRRANNLLHNLMSRNGIKHNILRFNVTKEWLLKGKDPT